MRCIANFLSGSDMWGVQRNECIKGEIKNKTSKIVPINLIIY